MQRTRIIENPIEIERRDDGSGWGPAIVCWLIVLFCLACVLFQFRYTRKRPMIPTNNPYTKIVDITPADSDFASGAQYRGFYIENAGNVRLTTADGDDITFTSPTTKVWHPVCFKRIWSTSTTATGIKAGL